jgi:DNA-binding CsgD family transcriptional regulator
MGGIVMGAILGRRVASIATEGRALATAGLSRLIDSIGRKDFAHHLLNFFDELLDADHCAVYQSEENELVELCSANRDEVTRLSESDLTSYEIKRCLRQTSKLGSDVVTFGMGDPARVSRIGGAVRHGLMIIGQRLERRYCIRVLALPPDEFMFDAVVDRLRGMADTLTSIVARHGDLAFDKSDVTPALVSLDRIQACLLSAGFLTRRESEVCARILFGYSSCGIALDLGIGKQSVMTYRKRAYQRLGIGTQRELLMWYLNLWSGSHIEALKIN